MSIAPWENGHNESFSGTLREQLLNGGDLLQPQGGQVIIDSGGSISIRNDQIVRWATVHRRRLPPTQNQQKSSEARYCRKLNSFHSNWTKRSDRSIGVPAQEQQAGQRHYGAKYEGVRLQRPRPPNARTVPHATCLSICPNYFEHVQVPFSPYS